MKLCDIEIAEEKKKLLAYCYEPKSIAEIMGKLKVGRDKAYRMVNELIADEFLKKDESNIGRFFYKMNIKVIDEL